MTSEMILLSAAALICILNGVSSEVPQQNQYCHYEKENSVFKFSVVSRKNQTGNWIAQVHFDHGAEDKDADPWEFEIDHSASKCGDKETVAIDATITSPVKISTRPAKTARSDYEYVPGLGYYKMHTEATTWLNALMICAKEDAHLLILDSEAEVKGLLPFLNRHPKDIGDWRDNVFLIGIHDYFAESQYYTVLGDPVTSLGYNKWSSEPSDSTERCGMVLLDGTLGDCSHQHLLYFICEHRV